MKTAIDAELIDACKRGDHTGFGRIVRLRESARRTRSITWLATTLLLP